MIVQMPGSLSHARIGICESNDLGHEIFYKLCNILEKTGSLWKFSQYRPESCMQNC